MATFSVLWSGVRQTFSIQLHLTASVIKTASTHLTDNQSLIPEQATVAGKSPFNRKKQNQAHRGGVLLLMAGRRKEDKKGKQSIFSLVGAARSQTSTDTENRHGNITQPLLLSWRLAATERTTSPDSRCVIRFITGHAGTRATKAHSRASEQIQPSDNAQPFFPLSILVPFTMRSLLSPLTYEGHSEGWHHLH